MGSEATSIWNVLMGHPEGSHDGLRSRTLKQGNIEKGKAAIVPLKFQRWVLQHSGLLMQRRTLLLNRVRGEGQLITGFDPPT